MADHAHLSIGEVLSLLQDEFPDVTISKIRFLESQGLLDPERTPSGYRKFYEDDISRLRWILTQQKENFLPLKVIKDRLAEAGTGPVGTGGDPGEAGRIPGEGSVSVPPPIWMADAARAAAARSQEDGADAASGRAADSVRPAEGSNSDVDQPRTKLANPLDMGHSSVSLTFDELVSACGLEVEKLRELERFGLVEGHGVGTETYYDGEALVIAQKAAGFLRHGIEARHLRMFKVGAEREAGFLEQVVMPMMKQRNPSARQHAVETLGELAALGEGLRAALL
ncbi:MAG: MerR family transcriptional regulator, partial [Acidimicrobiales bacterium]